MTVVTANKISNPLPLIGIDYDRRFSRSPLWKISFLNLGFTVRAGPIGSPHPIHHDKAKRMMVTLGLIFLPTRLIPLRFDSLEKKSRWREPFWTEILHF
jgi:hypothetical protein